MKRLLYPFLLTLASLLFNYARADLATSFWQVGRPLVVQWALLAVLVLPAYALFRRWDSVGFVLLLFASVVYFQIAFFLEVLFVVLLTFGMYLIYARLTGTKRRVAEMLDWLTLASAVMILFELAVVIHSLGDFPARAYLAELTGADRPAPVSLTSAVPSEQPDIYYIVLDGYGREDILNSLYGFDNAGFIGALEERGFIVPSNNHSNYPRTVPSIVSTLNFNYLQTLAPGLDQTDYWWALKPLLDDNAVAASLQKIGYRTVSIATDFSDTNDLKTNVTYRPFPVMVSDFEMFLLESTPFEMVDPLLKPFASIPTNASHQKIVEYDFSSLASIASLPGSKFVFAHVISPHPPFIFAANGTALNPRATLDLADASNFPGSRLDYRQGYVQQVQFDNAEILSAIDRILSASRVPPIIILQADHGPGMLTNFGSAAQTCLSERFSPFAAYYLPGSASSAIPDDLTSVNLFRIVFDQYFGADLQLLPNSQYFYQRSGTSLDLIDVTGSVGTSCN